MEVWYDPKYITLEPPKTQTPKAHVRRHTK